MGLFAVCEMLDRRLDRDLVSSTLRGEQAAYAVLVDRYKVSLAGYFLRLGVPRSVLDDLVQDAFVEAYRSLDRFQAPHHFGGWLRRIGYRLFLGWVGREQARREGLKEFAEFQQADQDRLAADPEQRAKDRVQEMIGHLSPQVRELLTDHYLHGSTLESIARKTGQSERSVRRKIKQAVEHLRRRHSKWVRSRLHSPEETGMDREVSR